MPPQHMPPQQMPQMFNVPVMHVWNGNQAQGQPQAFHGAEPADKDWDEIDFDLAEQRQPPPMPTSQHGRQPMPQHGQGFPQNMHQQMPPDRQQEHLFQQIPPPMSMNVPPSMQQHMQHKGAPPYMQQQMPPMPPQNSGEQLWRHLQEQMEQQLQQLQQQLRMTKGMSQRQIQQRMSQARQAAQQQMQQQWEYQMEYEASCHPQQFPQNFAGPGKGMSSGSKGGDGGKRNDFNDGFRRKGNWQQPEENAWYDSWPNAARGGNWQQEAPWDRGWQQDPWSEVGESSRSPNAYVPPHRRGKKGEKGGKSRNEPQGPDPEDINAISRQGGRGAGRGGQRSGPQDAYQQQSKGKGGRGNDWKGFKDNDERYQPPGDSPQDMHRSQGLRSTLRQVGKPATSKGQEARAAAATGDMWQGMYGKGNFGKPDADQMPEDAAGDPSGAYPSSSSAADPSAFPNAASMGKKGKGKGKALRGSQLPQHSLSVKWVYPGNLAKPNLPNEGDPDDAETDAAAWAAALGVEASDLMDMREVRMRLENAVSGCQVTVHLNGEKSVLNSSGFGRRRGAVAAQERRFAISSLLKPAGDTADKVETAVQDERPPEVTGGESAEEDEASQAAEKREAPEEEAPSAAEPEAADEADEDPSRSPEEQDEQEADSMSLNGEDSSGAPAAFAATVTLDTTEVQAKTMQELIEPDVEVVDVFDTAVVLRMTELTGDRFELTVYASGGTDTMGNAATLVHRGPIRTPESVQRIGQLEASQVYVAWVRVFCEGEVRESKQKGFKTLQARVKTIWDEPDHVILGVEKDATAKEITKAFRQKSLQCHPDKETDPEKKDAAEEHMKRLNLAKQNMMRGARREPEEPGDGSEPATPCGGDTPTPSPSNMNTQSSRRSKYGFFDEDFESGDEFISSEEDSPEKGKGKGKSKAEASEEPQVSQRKEEGTLGVGLRIEAAKPPKLQVIERQLTALVIEACGLPLRGMVEVQKFEDDQWQAALPPVQVTSDSMRFTLPDLQENSSHRLRLRTTIELEPLRLPFLRFKAPERIESKRASRVLNHALNEHELPHPESGSEAGEPELGVPAGEAPGSAHGEDHRGTYDPPERGDSDIEDIEDLAK